MLTSFSATTLKAVRAAYPTLRTALIGSRGERPAVSTVRSLGASYLGHWKTLGPRYVGALHASGVRVYGWTADTADAWTVLRDAGADGVITDVTPDYLAWTSDHC